MNLKKLLSRNKEDADDTAKITTKIKSKVKPAKDGATAPAAQSKNPKRPPATVGRGEAPIVRKQVLQSNSAAMSIVSSRSGNSSRTGISASTFEKSSKKSETKESMSTASDASQTTADSSQMSSSNPSPDSSSGSKKVGQESSAKSPVSASSDSASSSSNGQSQRSNDLAAVIPALASAKISGGVSSNSKDKVAITVISPTAHSSTVSSDAQGWTRVGKRGKKYANSIKSISSSAPSSPRKDRTLLSPGPGTAVGRSASVASSMKKKSLQTNKAASKASPESSAPSSVTAEFLKSPSESGTSSSKPSSPVKANASSPKDKLHLESPKQASAATSATGASSSENSGATSSLSKNLAAASLATSETDTSKSSKVTESTLSSAKDTKSSGLVSDSTGSKSTSATSPTELTVSDSIGIESSPNDGTPIAPKRKGKKSKGIDGEKPAVEKKKIDTNARIEEWRQTVTQPSPPQKNLSSDEDRPLGKQFQNSSMSPPPGAGVPQQQWMNANGPMSAHPAMMYHPQYPHPFAPHPMHQMQMMAAAAAMMGQNVTPPILQSGSDSTPSGGTASGGSDDLTPFDSISNVPSNAPKIAANGVPAGQNLNRNSMMYQPMYPAAIYHHPGGMPMMPMYYPPPSALPPMSARPMTPGPNQFAQPVQQQPVRRGQSSKEVPQWMRDEEAKIGGQGTLMEKVKTGRDNMPPASARNLVSHISYDKQHGHVPLMRKDAVGQQSQMQGMGMQMPPQTPLMTPYGMVHPQNPYFASGVPMMPGYPMQPGMGAMRPPMQAMALQDDDDKPLMRK